MPAILSNSWTVSDGVKYNFDYIIVPTKRAGAENISWSEFYTAVPGWDPDRSRPSDWIQIKMTKKVYVTYSPAQPFILEADPVSRYVCFADFEPADRRTKYKWIRTLKEKEPGLVPDEPAAAEMLIASQPDVELITRTLTEIDREQELLKEPDTTKRQEPKPEPTRTKEEPKPTSEPKASGSNNLEGTIQNQIRSTLEQLLPKSSRTEAQIRAEIRAEYEERRRSPERQRRYEPPRRRYESRRDYRRSPSPKPDVVELLRKGLDQLTQEKTESGNKELLQQQQLILQQQQQILQQQQARKAFELPLEQPLLPYPVRKRPALEFPRLPPSPETTPDRPRKPPAQHPRLWRQFQQQHQNDFDY
jgi:hypothetical protein